MHLARSYLVIGVISSSKLRYGVNVRVADQGGGAYSIDREGRPHGNAIEE